MNSDQADRSWIETMVRPADFGSVKVSYDLYRALQPPRNWNDVEPQQRSLHDLLVGSRQFIITGNFGWDFTVERARVIGPSEGTCLAIVNAQFRERSQQERERLVEQVREFRQQLLGKQKPDETVATPEPR